MSLSHAHWVSTRSGLPARLIGGAGVSQMKDNCAANRLAGRMEKLADFDRHSFTTQKPIAILKKAA